MYLTWYTLLVYALEFTTPCWSATSSLLHLNQFQGEGQCPLAPLLNTPMHDQLNTRHFNIFFMNFLKGGGAKFQLVPGRQLPWLRH